ncbi:MAG: SNF2 helicase associated domain-containing protein, partial [Verrucomicrobiota bacterium]
MSNVIELSRKFLSDTGGWKEMKEARSIHAAGRVSDATYRNGMLEGTVRAGEKTLKVRMEVQSRIDVINHCPCFRARRDGIICAHALAVGLEVIEPTVKSAVPAQSSTAMAKEAPVPISPDWPNFTERPGENATPAQLFLVVAPNLDQAWYKGRITTGIEVEVEGERKLLTAISGSAELFLSSSDAALYRILQQISPEAAPGMLSFSTDDLARIFATIPGHDRITLGKNTPLKLSPLPYRPTISRGKGLRFQVSWPGNVIPLASTRGVWAMTEADRVQPVAPGLESRWQSVMVSGLTVETADFTAAFSAFQTHFDTEEIEVVRPAATIQLEIEGSLNHLDAELSFNYGDETIPAAVDRPAVVESNSVLRLADTASETAAIRDLEEAGFTRRGDSGRWVLKDKAAILQFLGHGFQELQSGWRTETGERFDHALGQVEPIETRLDFRSSGEDWFAMEVGFGTDSENTIERHEIERLL